MRLFTLGVAVFAFLLGSCAGPMIGNAPVRGWFGKLSMDDVRAAVAVDQSGSDRLPRDIHEIEITSDTEIHIYGTRRNNHLEIYREVKLVRGQWRRGDRVIVTH